jgi:hypothetical protein
MRVLSPVGAFPLSVTGARLSRAGLVIDTAMGAWRSEVRVERRDLPLVALAAGTLAAAFTLGYSAGKRGGT